MADIDMQERILVDMEAKPPRTPRQKSSSSSDVPPSSKMEETSRYTKDIRGTFNELLNHCRIMFCIQFHLENVAEIIRAIWGDKIKRYDWEWTESRHRLGWHATNWKTRSVDNMKVSNGDLVLTVVLSWLTLYVKLKIGDYFKKDGGLELQNCDTIVACVDWFAERYHATTFAWVFDFSLAAVDVVMTDAKDSEWHFYFKSR